MASSAFRTVEYLEPKFERDETFHSAKKPCPSFTVSCYLSCAINWVKGSCLGPVHGFNICCFTFGLGIIRTSAEVLR